MRQTVDEKLHNTLEQRLGESFKTVSDHLLQVQNGLGEMRSLASGVGDLRRVLTNVKVRGTWGEVQLENLLEQILNPNQYQRNVKPDPKTDNVVDFGIKLPGQDDGTPIWLPIDSKFPLEDYQRLVEAQEQGDVASMELASKALEQRIKVEAKTIHEKYIIPPYTTDFALLFLPIESLYAEVIRRPGLFDYLQREYRVTVVSPTTISAILNSLQMGFRTLAIEKRSSDVWMTLGLVKTEFGNFSKILDKTKKKLDEASKTIENTQKRTREVDKILKDVQTLPAADSMVLLPELNEINSEE
jgi:DNA recombination protein RmuC